MMKFLKLQKAGMLFVLRGLTSYCQDKKTEKKCKQHKQKSSNTKLQETAQWVIQ